MDKLFIGQEMDCCLLVRKWIVIYWSGNGWLFIGQEMDKLFIGQEMDKLLIGWEMDKLFIGQEMDSCLLVRKWIVVY